MPLNGLRMRVANIQDVDVLTDFNCRLAQETEDRTLDTNTVRRGVERGLAAGEEVTYLVAETDREVVGQLMLTREWSDWRDGWMYWLQSVYVAAEYRGQGVFRALLKHATSQLQQRSDVVGLRLYVEEDNRAAQATYQQLGFVNPGYRVLELSLNSSKN